MASRSPVVADLPATSAAEGTSIIARSGPGSTAYDIPLVGGLSPSDSFSYASSTPSSAADRGPAAGKAGPVGTRRRSSSPIPRPPVPPAAAAAAATTTEVVHTQFNFGIEMDHSPFPI